MSAVLVTLITTWSWLLRLLALHGNSISPFADAINPACQCVLMKSPATTATAISSSSSVIITHSAAAASTQRVHGTLTSPNFPRSYSAGINCILYTIVASKSQLVELTFVEFDMAPPVKNRCVDFLRVYLDLESPEINERHAWNYELCGNVSTMAGRKFYSSTSTMILELHSDPRPASSAAPSPFQRGGHIGFRAIYRFVEKSDYETIGGSRRWGQGTRCSYDFHSGKSNNVTVSTAGSPGIFGGRFFSPRYPQNYPPNTMCQYTFYGRRNELVRITFDNIQLEHFDGSCSDSPDYISVRDGADPMAPLIARLCNTVNGHRVTSSGKNLAVEFTSNARNQRQGFAASYAFIPDADERQAQGHVNSPGIDGHLPVRDDERDVRHPSPAGAGVDIVGAQLGPLVTPGHVRPGDLRGSGGDGIGATRVSDRPKTPGTMLNPGDSPITIHSAFAVDVDNKKLFQSNCGSDNHFDSQQHRKSGVFKTPSYPNPYPADVNCRYTFQGYDNERIQIAFLEFDVAVSPGADPAHNNCDDADSVKAFVYIDDVPKEIGVYCGNSKPPMLMSSSTLMEIVFSSRGSSSSRGFIANYSFVTDFGIKSGEQNTNMTCEFRFKSQKASNGTFTSPNFPGLYPRNIECHYLFYGNENERIFITFPAFDVDGFMPRCHELESQSDYVEFSNFNIALMDRKMSRLCGMKADLVKNEVNSDSNFFRVTFKSNDAFDSTGFTAFYQFRKVEDPAASTRTTGRTSRDRSSATTVSTRCRTVPTWLVAMVIQSGAVLFSSRRRHVICMA